MVQDANLTLECTAHHEAGHLVIAAAQELKLRPEGLSVDRRGSGLACYYKQPGESDLSRERVIIATLAGLAAQKRFCEERSYPAPGTMAVEFSHDWREARELLQALSTEYVLNENLEAIGRRLESRSEQLVEEHWLIIKALATALIAKHWEPLKPLKSGDKWSEETEAKYVEGHEVVSILRRCGMPAVCDP